MILPRVYGRILFEGNIGNRAMGGGLQMLMGEIQVFGRVFALWQWSLVGTLDIVYSSEDIFFWLDKWLGDSFGPIVSYAFLSSSK